MRQIPCLLLALLLPSFALAQAPEPSTVGFVDSPAGKLWYETQGRGVPLVFLHDGLLPSATWDEQLPFFAQRFRAIRYDRRGFGRSEPPKASYSDVEDLAMVLDALGVRRAILMGCSSGAEISVDFALAYPERVEALVLVGPVVSGLAYSEHFMRRGLLNYRPMFGEKSVAKLIDNWVADPYFVSAGSPRAKQRLRALLTEFPGPAAGAVPDGRPTEKPAISRLGEIERLTLIVVGADDIPDVHAHAGALEAGIARARRVVVAGAGHLVHLEKPAELNARVLEFLRPGEVAATYFHSIDRAAVLQASRGVFDYDAKAPLDLQEASTDNRDGVKVVDLTYASPKGGRVPAFLVLPPGEGKHPAVLFLHPGQGDRSTFVEEAIGLAGHGIVSLAITAPYKRPENKDRRQGLFQPGPGREEKVQTIVDLRRGFDLLASRPEVDPQRMAYVGHSLGATMGGTLAGVEKRPVAYVLMAGYPSITHSYTHGHDRTAIAFAELLTAEQRKAYLDAMAPLDAVAYIGQAAPAKILFQFAHRDEYISYFDAALYMQAASDPKQVKWYDTGHFFNEEAQKDREAWLLETLGVKPTSAP